MKSASHVVSRWLSIGAGRKAGAAALGLVVVAGLGGVGVSAARGTMAAGMNGAMAAGAVRGAEPGNIVEVASGAGSFKTLLAAATAADLVGVLSGPGPLTVFAPSDEAFAKLGKHAIADLLKPENKEKLRTVLLYHVVPGKVSAQQAFGLSGADTASGQRLEISRKDGQLKVDKSSVVATDIAASNGVIHVIDRVLIPSDRTVVQTAVDANFKTLVAAVKAAGLAEALSGAGPFTVLAPTDEAFAKLGKETLGQLLLAENKEQLATILKLHVIPGRVFADAAAKGDAAKTLAGEAVTFALKDGRLMVSGAGVVKTDIDASNGVVHVIDTVLLPKEVKLKSAPASGASMPVAMSETSPAMLVEVAISRGVPVFNRGEYEGCAAIYEVATRGLLGMNSVSQATKARLRTALGEADAIKDQAEKAWALRRGLDAAAAMMGGAN